MLTPCYLNVNGPAGERPSGPQSKMFGIIATQLDQARPVALDQEDNLLVTAVSLLVQRQVDMETWLGEQFREAERSTARVEQRYLDLEARLGQIETRLGLLTRRYEPTPIEAEHVVRLRDQVARLSHVRPSPPAPQPGVAPPAEVAPPPEVAPLVEPVVEPVALPRQAPASVATPSRSVWDALGATPADRSAVLVMGAGAVAVLYALLKQLGFS